MALCAVLILCQLLAFPAAAEPLPEDAVGTEDTIGAGESVDSEDATDAEDDTGAEDVEDTVGTEDAGTPEVPGVDYTEYKNEMPDTKADAEVIVG